jgi:alkaline phosphatase
MATHKSPRWGHPMITVAMTLLVVTMALAIASRFAPWEVPAGDLIIRSQPDLTHPFPPPESGELLTASRRQSVVVDEETQPRNVILVIGDGMGVGQISTASALLHGPEGGLAIDKAPVTGFVVTHTGNTLVTDSAASATAMATGFKVPKKAISILPDGSVPVTIFEAAEAIGMSTGLVTTSGLVDATPAGFTSHAEKREHYSDILEDMLASRVELLIGGDWADHDKAPRDAGFQEMLGRIDDLGSDAGYTVVRDGAELDSTQGPVLALFPPREGGGGSAHGPPLIDVVNFAIDRLENAEKGFLLLVESEVTDGMGHSNNIAGLTEGIRELDTAVESILAWAEPRGDTLVLVTADHDTGGLGIVDGDYRDGVAEVRWATEDHTGQWVPLFAFGPGSEYFNGVIDNTDIGILIAKLLRIEDFPAIHP